MVCLESLMMLKLDNGHVLSEILRQLLLINIIINIYLY